MVLIGDCVSSRGEAFNGVIHGFELDHPCAGLSRWFWFGCLVSYAAAKVLGDASEPLLTVPLIGITFQPSLTLWLVTSLIGFPMLLAQDRARKFFPVRLPIAARLVAVAVAGPVVATWVLAMLLA